LALRDISRRRANLVAIRAKRTLPSWRLANGFMGWQPKGYPNGPDDFEQIAHIARVTVALTKQKTKSAAGRFGGRTPLGLLLEVQMSDTFLSRRKIASRGGFSPNALKNYAERGIGPEFVKSVVLAATA
jgi:hypothetical protein